MIVPSIDLQSGSAVQLIGGETKAIDAGDPLPIARDFSIAGEIAVIDLDAALGQGSNETTIRNLVSKYSCRVGGGIRSLESARSWLDCGASKVILGTKAVPEILSGLPRERVIAALDARDGEVVVEGWTRRTGDSILQKVEELKEYVGGFLVTFVEREGRMGGTRMDLVDGLVKAAHPARVTIAGGITSKEEIGELDRLGADAQVGMAIYSKRLSLAECVCAPLVSDRADGLWPTLVCDERGVSLGLAWSSAESVREAVETRSGVYFSRSRNALWRKGASSGATQELVSISLDCDRDALRFTVKQNRPGFCHNNTATCFGPYRGLSALEATLLDRSVSAPDDSYSGRLFSDPDLLSAKIVEEAKEFVEACTPYEVAHEAADLFFFALAKLRKTGVELAQVEKILDGRALKLSRRPGDKKV